MNHHNLPKRTPHEPPIQGPHEVVGEPGITHHYVFAGPNARQRPEAATDAPITDADLAPLAASLNDAPQRPRWQRITLRILDWLLIPVGVITGAVLALAWDGLDTRARLAVTALTFCAAIGHWTIRRTRRRKVRG